MPRLLPLPFSVSLVPDPKKDVIQPTAYILFYERIDEKTDTSILSKTTQDKVSSVPEASPEEVDANNKITS
ncbi:unnamed protein product [Hydatigera taeniaeformis]|uniref:Velvet domain-containing protein n=1 Tax=Hydatigena taeniaeformis TaxID=6205 RepID=A0A0R3XCN3_HYDTA|nr:unnamed protein product [Hydatigera taeniaeformis]